MSGSKEPTYHVDSLIYVKDIDPADIEIGDPITFAVNEEEVSDENGYTVTEEVALDKSTYYYQTKDDVNEDVDGALVHYRKRSWKPGFLHLISRISVGLAADMKRNDYRNLHYTRDSDSYLTA